MNFLVTASSLNSIFSINYMLFFGGLLLPLSLTEFLIMIQEKLIKEKAPKSTNDKFLKISVCVSITSIVLALFLLVLFVKTLFVFADFY